MSVPYPLAADALHGLGAAAAAPPRTVASGRGSLELSLRLARPGFALDIAATLPGRGVTALFGPSGCGKTTVLRALAGLERAAGRVALNGEVWQDDSRSVFVPTHRRPIGYVIQEPTLFPHLNVRRNLDYGLRRVPPAQRRIGLERSLELLGIGPLLERAPAALSGGERQRVAIARALLTSPQLLLMDEPLAALDARRKAEILPYLERLAVELSMPIVYVTHSMGEVARLADHLVLIDAGRLRAAGPVHEVLARTDVPGAEPDDAGVVLDARVLEHDAPFGLTRIGAGAAALWVGAVDRPPGSAVRARVLARDVSVARSAATDSSILNVLPVTLCGWRAEATTVLLGLAFGHGAGTAPAQLLARITRRSFEALQLRPGDALHAQVKGVSLMR